jgi:hypothetical protein
MVLIWEEKVVRDIALIVMIELRSGILLVYALLESELHCVGNFDRRKKLSYICMLQ